MKLEEVLMATGIGEDIKKIFLSLASKNKYPSFNDVLKKLKKENPSVKTLLDTPQRRDSEEERNKEEKLEKYKDMYYTVVDSYKKGEIK